MNDLHSEHAPFVPGRTALVRPRYDGTDHEFQEPLGAEAICGYLLARGAEARVFDRRLGASVSDIEKFCPDWVGFSLMTEEDAPDALRLRQMLSRPGRRFFAGGLFVTSCMEKARALFPSDTTLIPGEGEGPVWELLTFGEVREGPRPGPNEWAFASRENLSEYLARGGVINIRTARGCRGGCAFCTTPRLCAPKGFETRDVSLVADEMASLVRAGYPPVFNFTDDMFGGCDRVEELEEALSLRGVRAAFSLEMRAREVSMTPPDLWKRLYGGGLCRVFTGMESLNPDTLRAWHKPVDKVIGYIRDISEDEIKVGTARGRKAPCGRPRGCTPWDFCLRRPPFPAWCCSPAARCTRNGKPGASNCASSAARPPACTICGRTCFFRF